MDLEDWKRYLKERNLMQVAPTIARPLSRRWLGRQLCRSQLAFACVLPLDMAKYNG